MTIVHGQYKNGAIQIDEPVPADWSEGLKIRLVPIESQCGTVNGADVADPEDYASWLAFMESLKEFQMSDEQAEEWDRHLNEKKEQDKLMWEKRSREIEDMFP